ncbi:MAG: DUF3276 family protein [Tepidisphaeraceae bacterium]
MPATQAAPAARRSPSAASVQSRPGNRRPAPTGGRPANDKPDPILYQSWFKSVNPQRTYATQIKRARNGNRYAVVTEGKRDKQTGELKKISVYVYEEDFEALLGLFAQLADWVKKHPTPPDLRRRRAAFWAKKKLAGDSPAASSLPHAQAVPARM